VCMRPGGTLGATEVPPTECAGRRSSVPENGAQATTLSLLLALPRSIKNARINSEVAGRLRRNAECIRK
jgi:hypothetical protein